MATTVEQLAEQAMTLPSESRARLADLLVDSLEGADLGRIEQLWITEAKRRRDEVRDGKVETIPGDAGLRQCVIHSAMRYEFHPEALEEHRKAARWYAERAPDLGLQIIGSVEDAIKRTSNLHCLHAATEAS